MVIFNSKLLVYQRVMMSKSIVRFLRYQLGDFNVFFALLNGLPSCNVAMEKKGHRTITIHRCSMLNNQSSVLPNSS